MKKTLITLLLIINTLVLFAQNGDSGKSYYDADKTKPKEVFSFKEKTSFDPNNPSAPKTVTKLKHGPYFFYYENGKLKISGSYKDDKKQGEWKNYDANGNLKKIDTYLDDVLKDSKNL
jgi:antitoxin component YwqK of YwqJK toxin-antitoxin module